jgi:hypothetical protein
MTHDHAQVGIHVRKQLSVVEKQSVIMPRALSLNQVTVKDHRHALKRKLLCVKYTKRLMGSISISRAVLGQLHDDKISRVLAGQRRKSNRAAGGGKHRHHKRRIIVDICGNCTAKDRQHELHPPHSTLKQKTLGALPTALKTAHPPRRGMEHQHWTWRTGTT